MDGILLRYTEVRIKFSFSSLLSLTRRRSAVLRNEPREEGTDRLLQQGCGRYRQEGVGRQNDYNFGSG